MKYPLLYIFIILLSSLHSLSLSGQPAANSEYEDLVLYKQLLEAEQRDSTYYSAYLEFEQSGGFEAPPTRHDSKTAQELATLSAQFTEAFWVERDYDKAFYVGFQLEEKLPLVSEEQYPDKRKDYFKLGEAYYLFLDNYKSIELLEKALSPVPTGDSYLPVPDPHQASPDSGLRSVSSSGLSRTRFTDRTNLDALKIIGICYANIGDWKKSDEYFRATLLSDNIVLYRPLYNAYAISHLSCNAMLTGQYDKALALSHAVWPTLRKTDDYGHLAGMCYCRGRSHLEKGEFRQASAWVDSLVYFSRKDQYNQTKRVKQAYQLQADYHTAMGDAGQAKIYNDSLVGLYKTGEQLYTSHYIAGAARQYNNEKIEAHVAALKTSRTRIAVISVFALLSLAAAIGITSLYRKKNAAYKALAAKARQWADSGTALKGVDNYGFPSTWSTQDGDIETPDPAPADIPGNPDNGHEGISDEESKALADRLYSYMVEYKPYTDPELSLESLAQMLGVTRNKLSAVINRASDKSFKLYVNDLRVMEALRLMTATAPDRLSMEQLMEQAGFNGRTTFYTSFKSITGLTPAQYWKNIDYGKDN